MIKVYTKTVCPQCTPVKAYLKAHNIEHEIINIDNDNDKDAYNYLKENNYTTTPVMILYENQKPVAVSTGRNASLDVMKWTK